MQSVRIPLRQSITASERGASAPCCPVIGDRTVSQVIGQVDNGHSPGRAGTTLVELIVAGILLGSVMVVAVPALGLVAHQRRAGERRVQALLEVENLMEQMTARDWEEINPETAEELQVSAAIQKQLPAAALRCRVETAEGEPAVKRIRIELSWTNRHGQAVAPVRLTGWVYRNGRAR